MGWLKYFKGLVCGLSAGVVMIFTNILVRRLVSDIEVQLGSFDKMPQLTRFVDSLFTNDEAMAMLGVLIFTLGYIWLAILNKPTPLVCVLHLVLAFVFMALASAALPYIQIHQGLTEKSGAAFDPARDLPWLGCCSVPLLVALWLKRMKNRIMVEQFQSGGWDVLRPGEHRD
jgi:hypothetical protein